MHITKHMDDMINIITNINYHSMNDSYKSIVTLVVNFDGDK